MEELTHDFTAPDAGAEQPKAKKNAKHGSPISELPELTAVAEDTFVHGFKIPFEILPQHRGAESISFMRAQQVYNMSPADLLILAGNEKKINPKVAIGPIPWRAAIGIFVNKIDGGRNQQTQELIEAKKTEDFQKNLN